MGYPGSVPEAGKEYASEGEQPQFEQDAVIDMSTQHETHAMSEQPAASLSSPPSQGTGDHERIDSTANTFGLPAPRDDEDFEPTIVRGRE